MRQMARAVEELGCAEVHLGLERIDQRMALRVAGGDQHLGQIGPHVCAVPHGEIAGRGRRGLFLRHRSAGRPPTGHASIEQMQPLGRVPAVQQFVVEARREVAAALVVDHHRAARRHAPGLNAPLHRLRIRFVRAVREEIDMHRAGYVARLVQLDRLGIEHQHVARSERLLQPGDVDERTEVGLGERRRQQAEAHDKGHDRAAAQRVPDWFHRRTPRATEEAAP